MKKNQKANLREKNFKRMSLAKKINLKDDEKIIMVVRPYVLAYVWKYVLGGIFLFASSFFMFRLFFYSWWGEVVYALGMLIGFYFILSALFKNRGNMLVITSSRAVDVHRLGWFDEIISSVNYLDVKDIAIRKKGLWQSLFNVGGVSIVTKSENFALEIFHIHIRTASLEQTAQDDQRAPLPAHLVGEEVGGGARARGRLRFVAGAHLRRAPAL